MGLLKEIPINQPGNVSGLKLSYHMIGQYVVDRKGKRIVVRLLSFVDKKQRDASMLGGFEVLPPCGFLEKDFEEIMKGKNIVDALYSIISESKELGNKKNDLYKAERV